MSTYAKVKNQTSWQVMNKKDTENGFFDCNILIPTIFSPPSKKMDGLLMFGSV